MKTYILTDPCQHSCKVVVEYEKNGARKVIEQRVDEDALANTVSPQGLIGAVQDNLWAQAIRDSEVLERTQRPSEGVNMATCDFSNYVVYQNTGEVTYIRAPDAFASEYVQSRTAMYEAAVSSYQSFGWNNKIPNIVVNLKLGRHTLQIVKDPNNGSIDITQEDIDKAKAEYIKTLGVNIIVKKAERKAEDLLKMFISEVDFRNYKEKGHFVVKSGDQVYRIWADKHKHVDMWERRQDGILIPKNRLCTHTQDRVLPVADEVVQKLMLIKSNRISQYANFHPIGGDMKEVHEKELILA